MGKKKIGEIYNRPIVIGDKNLKKDYEVHVDELGGGDINIDEILWFYNGYHACCTIDLKNKEIIATASDNNAAHCSVEDVQSDTITIQTQDYNNTLTLPAVSPISGISKVYDSQGNEIEKILYTHYSDKEGGTIVACKYYQSVGEYEDTIFEVETVSGNKYKLVFKLKSI